MSNTRRDPSFNKTERYNKELLEQWYKQIWNERRMDKINDYLSPGVIAHHESGAIVGPENWKKQVFETLTAGIPDMFFTLDDIVASGDMVIARWQARGTHLGNILGVPASGKPIKLTGMTWMRIAEGKIAESWNSSDVSHFLRELQWQVKTLRGILPLCSKCKKVRDDEGYWEQVDVYINNHSEADVTHGLCPDCLKSMYGNEGWFKKKLGKKYL